MDHRTRDLSESGLPQLLRSSGGRIRDHELRSDKRPQAVPNPIRVILLTSPGRGAVASVRVEGDGAAEIVGQQFRSIRQRPLVEIPIGQAAFGHWSSTDGEEVVLCRRACREHDLADSEAIEIHCHGGRVAVRAVMDSLIGLGCLEQSWSDWVMRQSKDAIVAEAQIALAQAGTLKTASILLDQFSGAFTREIRSIQRVLRSGAPDAAIQRLKPLLSRSALGLHLVQPWHVVLAGRPNVGKSSLINALVGYERAIVYDQPGTTRDAVTADAALDGWPVQLTDTAGLRRGGDALESAGIARARQQLGAADLVVLIFDGSQRWTTEDAKLAQGWPQAVMTYNKCDLPANHLPANRGERPLGFRISAKTGEGIDALVTEMASKLVPAPPPPGAAAPFTARQIDCLNRALAAVSDGQVETALGHLATICEQCDAIDNEVLAEPWRR